MASAGPARGPAQAVAYAVLVMSFSRWREYRADRGGAKLAGRDDMIAALRRLENRTFAARMPNGDHEHAIAPRVEARRLQIELQPPQLVE